MPELIGTITASEGEDADVRYTPTKDELDLQKTCINLLFDGLLGTKLTDENPRSTA